MLPNTQLSCNSLVATVTVISPDCIFSIISGETFAIALAADVAPEYAVLIGAIAAPAAKWADKTEKEYGIGSKE